MWRKQKFYKTSKEQVKKKKKNPKRVKINISHHWVTKFSRKLPLQISIVHTSHHHQISFSASTCKPQSYFSSMPIGGHLYCLYMPPSDQLSTSLFHQWPKYYHGTVQSLQLGVCNEPPTHQNRPDPTQLGGLGWFLRVGRLGWIMKFFLMVSQVGFK